ncbi:hypothetical protein [Streptomyces sp. NPDC093795]|uniref:hypothetical protein n=1 Tax=Streptomyces sp. NPDC093795 TaxID=3366051 RepID=UPI003818855B
MRHPLAAALGTVALTASMLVSAPLASASTSDYPVKSFEVVVGNTYTKGTITWYNRAVRVAGEHKAVASCRGTTAYTLDSAGRQLSMGMSPFAVCNGDSQKFSFDVPADVAGGAPVVRVCLDNGATPSPTPLECVLKNR